jgi:hypothetical protein
MAKLDLSQLISALANRASNHLTLLSQGMQRIEDGINNLGTQLAAEPVGLAAPPPPLQGVNVKPASGTGELVHVTLTHNAPIVKNIHYFLEYDNDPSFPAPHVEHLGTSRGKVLNLPTKTDGGVAQNWYFRGYPQFPGSKPAKPVNFGGIVPAPVVLGGTTQLTLQPSTGSGTAAGNGQQGGSGFGKTNTRAPIGPKRQIPA